MSTRRDQTLSRFAKQEGKQNLISLRSAKTIAPLCLPFQRPKKGEPVFLQYFGFQILQINFHCHSLFVLSSAT